MSLVAACSLARLIADFDLESNERLTSLPLVVARGVGKEWGMVFRGPAEDPGSVHQPENPFAKFGAWPHD